MTPTPGAGTIPSNEGSLDRQFDNHAQGIDEIDKLTMQIAERLVPVMAEPTPVDPHIPEQTEIRKDVTPSYRMRVRRMTNQLERIATLLRDVNARLEV